MRIRIVKKRSRKEKVVLFEDDKMIKRNYYKLVEKLLKY